MDSRTDRDFPSLLREHWRLGVILFALFSTSDILDWLSAAHSRASIAAFLTGLLVSPLVLAGVIGRLHESQRGGIRHRSFLGNMQRYAWPLLGINLCYLLIIGSAGVLMKLLGSTPAVKDAPVKPDAVTLLWWVPLGALVLFWRVAAVSDGGGIFRSLCRSLRALAHAPSALMLGLGWGVLSGLDRFVGAYSPQGALLRLAALRAAVFALAGIWVYWRALALYQEVKVAQWNETPAEPAVEAAALPGVEAHPSVGWPLALFSLVPGVNLLALVQGARAIRAGRAFPLRAIIACGAGGFSVLVCMLALLGRLLPRAGAAAERITLPAADRFVVSEGTHAVVYGIIMLLLLVSHEYAHAFAAWKLGDDTAKNQGRLTLNPLAHLDLIGSILLPGILIWRHSDVVFGWAKPVPVDTSKFANPRRDHRIVSFAGPGINLAVAMASFLLLALVLFALRLLAPGALSEKLASPFDAVSLVGAAGGPWLLGVISVLKQLMYTSLALGFFNLLPIPPLDGGWILSSVLPERARARFEALRPYSVAAFVLLAVTHVTDYVLAIPLLMAWGGLSLVCTALGFS